ncbi:MFS transporter, partial [Achromobacter xylosoxidans]|uniref:MFS transporter n=1 Tax=Alcaligenes xylosoxydans xylosoxydans TaxID=85698 RepID=UPI001F060F65
VKNLEIAIMLVAAWGFVASSPVVLLACTFLMGLHSTLFGPVKFAYLPQVLSERELTGGNGMVEMGTFVAILLGQVAGGLLVAVPGVGHAWVAACCVLLALAGLGHAGVALAVVAPGSPGRDPAALDPLHGAVDVEHLEHRLEPVAAELDPRLQGRGRQGPFGVGQGSERLAHLLLTWEAERGEVCPDVAVLDLGQQDDGRIIGAATGTADLLVVGHGRRGSAE